MTSNNTVGSIFTHAVIFLILSFFLIKTYALFRTINAILVIFIIFCRSFQPVKECLLWAYAKVMQLSTFDVGYSVTNSDKQTIGDFELKEKIDSILL